MCGIAGVVQLDSSRHLRVPIEIDVERMADRMKHRGPDAFGIWKSVSARAAFSHRRLAIVDLSGEARQPMSYAAARYWITFNGEIYNFRALRSHLSSMGHTFYTQSDTEVLLASIAQWGIDDALARLVGMFAFAVWDERDGVLHLARDRMGEKPLYVGEINRHLYFASELQALLAVPGLEPRISGTATAAFLRDGCIPGALSIFQGIYKLSPGRVVTVHAGAGQRLSDAWFQTQESNDLQELKPRAYWSPERTARNGQSALIESEKAAVEQGEIILREAVHLQMQADVPTGAFLSGGIDSSLITALMQELSGQPVHTFTVAFDDPRYDESKHARAIASHLGTHHEEFVLCEKDIVDQIPSLVDLMDEPTANGSFFPVYLISRLARTRVTVALSGDGGDELFAGYNRYALARKSWRVSRWIPRPLRNSAAHLLSSGTLPKEQFWFIARMARFGSQVGSADARRKLARILKSETFAETYRLLTSCWDQNTCLTENLQAPARYWPEASADDISTMLLADQIDYLPDDNLAKVDRASMAASLETRLPFLDHRVVEFSWRLPMTFKLRGRTTKWLLREILARHLPPTLTERPKMGFSIPTDRWLRGPLRAWAADMLLSSDFQDMVPIRKSALNGLWDSYLAGHGPSGYEIWSLVMLSAWAQSMVARSASSFSPSRAYQGPSS